MQWRLNPKWMEEALLLPLLPLVALLSMLTKVCGSFLVQDISDSKYQGVKRQPRRLSNLLPLLPSVALPLLLRQSLFKAMRNRNPVYLVKFTLHLPRRRMIWMWTAKVTRMRKPKTIMTRHCTVSVVNKVMEMYVFIFSSSMDRELFL